MGDYKTTLGWQGSQKASMMFNIDLVGATGLDLHIRFLRGFYGVFSM